MEKVLSGTDEVLGIAGTGDHNLSYCGIDMIIWLLCYSRFVSVVTSLFSDECDWLCEKNPCSHILCIFTKLAVKSIQFNQFLISLCQNKARDFLY